MASMNNAIPMLPKGFDLKDAVDRPDRLLEVAQQVVVQLQAQVFPMVIDPATGVAYTTPPAPAWISTANAAAYKTLLTNGTLATLIAAADSEYGIYEIAALLAFKFQQISALNPNNISNVA